MLGEINIQRPQSVWTGQDIRGLSSGEPGECFLTFVSQDGMSEQTYWLTRVVAEKLLDDLRRVVVAE